MATASDKNWAQEYIASPLHEPTPAEETGLIGSYAAGHAPKSKTSPRSSPIAAQTTGSSTSTNPFRRDRTPADIPTPSSKDGSTTKVRPLSTSSTPTRSPITEAFPRAASPRHSPSSSRGPSAGASTGKSSRSRRSSSLREKYPGDPSIHPLETLTREAKAANRSPHLKKTHLPGRDSIDRLDGAAFLGGGYHHEGPYDAAGLARNATPAASPVAAVAASNREALRATPPENVRDAVLKRRPLEGVASVPPGEIDRFGRTYHYREGPEEDMMRYGQPEGGAYKRYSGIEYLPEDLKGKGEPSYSIEKALKERSRSGGSRRGDAVELAERPRRSEHGSTSGYRDESPPGDETRPDNDNAAGSSTGASAAKYGDWERERAHAREGSIEGLKKRIGSLRRKEK